MIWGCDYFRKHPYIETTIVFTENSQAKNVDKRTSRVSNLLIQIESYLEPSNLQGFSVRLPVSGEHTPFSRGNLHETITSDCLQMVALPKRYRESAVLRVGNSVNCDQNFIAKGKPG